jgi:hypothetical protein
MCTQVFVTLVPHSKWRTWSGHCWLFSVATGHHDSIRPCSVLLQVLIAAQVFHEFLVLVVGDVIA